MTQVYTSGECKNNRAGIGVWWGENHSLNVEERVAGDKQTEKLAELKAVILALKQAIREGLRRVEVKTDSTYVTGSINLVATWKSNGWKKAKGKLPNREDWIELDRVWDNLGRDNVKWTYVKKKKHADTGSNEANQLAVTGAKK